MSTPSTYNDTTRRLAWIGSCALLLCSAIGYALSFERFDQWTLWRPTLFTTMGISMFGLLLSYPRRWSERRTALSLLIIAALARFALLPTPPSDDVHRYLWEGRLVSEGVSPYQYRGDDLQLQEYRDEQWELMNNKDKRTAYPPLSVYIFAVSGLISYTPVFFKVVFIFIDLAVVVVLLQLLRKRSLPIRYLALYSFNPVVLVSFAGEGHFDVLMLLFLALAALSIEKRYWLWAGSALALASMAKVISIIALPFILYHGKGKALLGFALTCLLLSLPFLSSLPELADGIYQFSSNRDFNSLPHLLGNPFGLGRSELGLPLLIALGLSLILIFWRKSNRIDWHLTWSSSVVALLILSQTNHFWYWSWAALALPFTRSPLVALTCLLQGLYFFVWREFELSGNWDLSSSATALMWSPVIMIGGGTAVLKALNWFTAKRTPLSREPDPTPESGILVVIPCYNAARELSACLDTVLPQLTAEDAIVIADAGSADESLEIAKRYDVPVVQSVKGRGNQVLAGLRSKPSRYALILHADAKLQPKSLLRLREALRANPAYPGGCFGQSFQQEGWFPTFTVEVLNEARAAFSGIAFGDQCQFFDRKAFPDESFPELPLMEDVELSLRLRSKGPLLYLANEVSSDPVKWRTAPKQRFTFVIRIVALFLTQRHFAQHRLPELARSLYKSYYPKTAQAKSNSATQQILLKQD